MPLIFIAPEKSGSHTFTASTSHSGSHAAIAATLLVRSHTVTASSSIRGEHTFTASSLREQEGVHLFTGRAKPDSEGSHTFKASSAPTEAFGRHMFLAHHASGTRVVRSGRGNSWKMETHALTGLADLQSWSYSRPDGATPSLQCTFNGAHGSYRDAGQAITVIATHPSGTKLAFTTERLKGNGAVQSKRSAGGAQTSINFGSEVQKKLSAPLPELVPWVGAVSAPPAGLSCAQRRAARKSIAVKAMIGSAIQAAGLKVKFIPQNFGAAFGGDIVQDTASDYSTAGKTLSQVLGDFYGKIGATIASKHIDTLLIIAPGEADDELPIDRNLLRRVTEEVQDNIPFGEPIGFIRINGKAVEVDLLEAFSLSGAPDQEALAFELNKTALDKSETHSAEGSVYTGVQKEGGVVTREGTIEIGNVTEKAPEGTKKPDREFTRVAKSETNTYKTYLGDCGGVLSMTYQQHREWGYSYQTQLQSAALSIPGWQFGISGGDEVGTATTQVLYDWSPQGWLKRRVTISVKTGSLAIENPGQANEKLLAGQKIRTITEETWLPTGGGRWLYRSTTSGDQLVPVFDKAGQTWVDIKKKTGVLGSITETTDNAPDMASCECDEVMKPHIYEYQNNSGMDRVEIDLPSEKEPELLGIHVRKAHARKETREWTVGLPLPVEYGKELLGYIVTSIQASSNGPSDFKMTITGEKIDAY